MAIVIRFNEAGGPEVLRREEMDVPGPGPEEVKIKVEAIGLNRAEIAYREGRYLERPKFPSKLGYEAAGTVMQVGSEVRGVTKGERVGVIPNFSMADYGTYGEEILVPASSVTPCPNDVSCVTFAAVWMQYLTAYGALVEIGGLKAGEYVLVTAASSSVGLAAIQIALAVGAVPIATTRTNGKREALLHAGAAHVIATDEQDLVAEVRKITGNSGARLIFDAIAGPGVEKLAKAAATGGTIIIYGGLSAQQTPFPGGLAMVRGLAMRGFTVFEITKDFERLARAKGFIYQGIANGTLRPTIDRSFRLKDIAEAHRYMENSEQIGKIIISVP
jgi:NADPH:quinone reductase-like Zn-dependent oxidoreductase